ncbi:MAG: hypothetical protein IT379_24880 [Deltaproteobacteria bacterium]|nr:hypothetical protein [Deltaproteobacteria bacterium]
MQLRTDEGAAVLLPSAIVRPFSSLWSSSSRSSLLGIAFVSGCCSAAAGASTPTPGSAPSVVTSNTPGGATTDATPMALSRYVLWCATPGGSACSRAAATLEVTPSDAASVPEPMLGPMRDTESDCTDPDVAGVTTLLQGPLGITARNWHDNVGASLQRESIAQTYSGGGCTNCCFAPNEPAVKVHVVATPDGLRFLVRVWEPGGFVNSACAQPHPGPLPVRGEGA